MPRCGRWIKQACCGTVVHVDFNDTPTQEELLEIARGPCYGCRERANRQAEESAAGLLVECSEHASGFCYVLPDGEHFGVDRCQCRFRFHDDCQVPSHLEIAHGRDARWNARRKREAQPPLPGGSDA
jgi:hypothetical protein